MQINKLTPLHFHPTEKISTSREKNEIVPKEASFQLQVLLVEDNPLAQKIANLMLASFDCKVDTADSGTHALKLFEPGKYDLVFMDLGLPDLSGFQVATHFREIEQSSRWRTPIVALTADRNDTIEKECLEVGMDRMLTKPLSLKQAKDLIDYYTVLIN